MRTLCTRAWFFACFFVIASIGCKAEKGAQRRSTDVPRSVDQGRITQDLLWLADDARRGRGSFTRDEKAIARFISARMKKVGLLAPPGGYVRPFSHDNRNSQNVAGYVSGCGTEVVVLGAHYDHLGVKGEAVYNGADDNASGTAVLLEVARVVAQKRFEASVWFVAFGAEEKGIRGSRAFVADPPVPLSNIRLMINLDMLGRAFLEQEFGHANPEGLGAIVHKVPESLKEALLNKAGVYKLNIVMVRDVFLRKFGSGFYYDSMPFNEKGLSTLFFSTSLHKDYHRPTDTSDKIRFRKLTRITKYLIDLLAVAARVKGGTCIPK